MTYDMSNNPTNCCAKFNPEPWQNTEHVMDDKKFITAPVRCFMHFPLNIAKVMKKQWGLIMETKNEVEPFFSFCEDPSPWRSDYFFQTKEEIPGAKNVRITGTFISRVYEGPYKDSPKWMKDFEDSLKEQGKEVKRMLAWYTTCPKCAKHWGKNYIVLFAQVS